MEDIELNYSENKLSCTSLLVSLFLFLLVFFILLNTLSRPDEKRKRSTLDSVNSSFSASLLSTPGIFGGVFINLAEYSLSQRAEQYARQIRHYLENAMDMEGSAVSNHDNVIRISLPIHMLFKKGSKELHDAKLPLFDFMASLMRNAQNEIWMSVECVIGTAAQLPKTPQGSLAVNRATEIARYFEMLGIAPESIIVGLTPYYHSNVILSLYVKSAPREQ